MEFQLAFRYIIDRSGGFTNLLLITVSQLIPAIGPILLLGYRAEVATALDRDPDLRRHPKFNFDRFVEYLTRGIWPFLISLILVLPMIPVFFLAIVAGLLIDPPGPNNPPFLAFAIACVVMFGSAILISILSVPMTFHAEYTGRFDLAGAFHFALAFWKHVGWLMIGTGLVFMFLAWVVAIIGLLFCFIGIYPASALTQMANVHLVVQLYRIYLDRGGVPLTPFAPPLRRDRDDDYEDEATRDEW